MTAAPALQPKRKRLRCLCRIALVALLCAALCLAFIATETGFRVLVRTANTMAGSYFSAERVEGRLMDSWHLVNVRIQAGKAVRISIDDLRFSWNPKALFVESTLHLRYVAVKGLTIRIAASNNKETKEAGRLMTLPDIRFPLRIRLDELHAAGSRIVFPDGKSALVINEALLQAVAHEHQIAIARIMVDCPEFGSDLHGTIAMNGAWPLQIRGLWRVADYGINELHGTVAAEGDTDRVAVSATMTTPAQATVKGHAYDLLNNLYWQIAGETGHFTLHDINVPVPVDGTLKIVKATGTTKGYSGVLSTEAHYEGYPTVHAQATVEAPDYSGLMINSFTVRHEDAQLSLRGGMRWIGGFSWQAELEGQGIDPTLAHLNLPGTLDGVFRSSGLLSAGKQALEVSVDGIQGRLHELPWSLKGRLGIEDKALFVDHLKLQSGTAHVQLNGKATSAKVDLAMQGQVDDLSSFAPEASGAMRIEGTAAGSLATPSVRLSLTGDTLRLHERSLAHLKADMAASLEKSSLLVDKLEVRADNKVTVDVKGRLGWAEGLAWQAEVHAAGVDPSLIAPEWPGTVNAVLRSQGKKSADTLVADLQIETLQGTLRGFPLTGKGKAAIDGSALLVDDLYLRSGSTYAQINGKADTAHALALSFKAGSDDLGSVAPESGGRFQLEGTLSGSPQQPSIALTASGSQLKMKAYALHDLKATVKAELAAAGQVDAEIKANGFTANKETINTVQLRVKGSAEQHRINFAAEGSPGKVMLAAAGGWKDQQWQGQLTELELANKPYGSWKVEHTADLLLSAARCALSNLALIHDQGMHAALSAQWVKEQGWQADAKVAALSFDLLRTWKVPLPPRFNGVLAATLSAQGTGALPQQAEVALVLPDLTLTAEDYEDDGGITTWHWRDNQITAKLKDDTVRLTAHTTFQDGSSARLEAAVDNCNAVNTPEQMPLSGKVDINIQDLGALAPLTAYTVQATGGFGGRIELHGTAARPKLNGTLALGKGAKGEASLYIPATGVTVQGLKLAVEGDGSTNQADLVLTSSGGGILRAKGTFNRTADQPLAANFSITGERFQAANLPEYQAVISPNLHLVYGKSGAALSGAVAMPKAKIAPLGFGGAISTSKDVVVVDREEGPLPATLPLSVDVALTLGNEVAVDTFGIKGFIDGGLRISAKPGQTVTALGTFSLRDTSVEFEGVALQLNEGRVYYQGGPIDNPGLDIRASKKIDNVEAGIHLTGNVDNMDIKLFSDTPMQDSEILSWLLSDQNSVSGNKGAKGAATISPAAAALSKMGGGALLKSVNPLGVVNMEDQVDLSIGGGKDASDVSLVMSKEIYKDLYISYGKDLTKEGGGFRARYDLDYGFSIESETSSSAAGADLLWSLER